MLFGWGMYVDADHCLMTIAKDIENEEDEEEEINGEEDDTSGTDATDDIDPQGQNHA